MKTFNILGPLTISKFLAESVKLNIKDPSFDPVEIEFSDFKDHLGRITESVVEFLPQCIGKFTLKLSMAYQLKHLCTKMSKMLSIL